MSAALIDTTGDARMHRREFLSQAVSAGLVSGTCCLSGCGTLLHSERHGQPHSRDLDWKIVALDSLGLVFFFVPGVVAFTVDFYTGAIYLPHDYDDGCVEYSGAGFGPGQQPMVVNPNGLAPQYLQPQQPQTQYLQPQPPQAPYPQAQPTQVPYPQTQYPPAQHPQVGPPAVGVLRRVPVPKNELDRQRIEQVVGQHVGRPVELSDPTTRVSPLARLDDFLATRERHQADRDFGVSTKQFFARLLSA
jgi:hypothetical protein